jgi:hypothetical protein
MVCMFIKYLPKIHSTGWDYAGHEQHPIHLIKEHYLKIQYINAPEKFRCLLPSPARGHAAERFHVL